MTLVDELGALIVAQKKDRASVNALCERVDELRRQIETIEVRMETRQNIRHDLEVRIGREE